MIPKILHQFWDGPLTPPHALMKEWETEYSKAGWDYMLWDTNMLSMHLPHKRLVNQAYYDAMPEWAGKCDIARYEILHFIGGFYVDADAKFNRLIEPDFLHNVAFCVYENEFLRPGLISNAFLASEPNSRLSTSLIREIHNLTLENLHPDIGKSTARKLALSSTGPMLLTNVIKKYNLRDVAVFPSFFFFPNHYDTSHPASKYNGPFMPFSDHIWGSTQDLY